MNSQKSENMPINSQPNRRLHRNDLRALIAIGSWLAIAIVAVLLLVLSRENFLELRIGEVVKYKNLLGDFGPQDNHNARSLLFGGLFFTLIISFIIGCVVGSRRSIVIARLGFVLSLVSCCLIFILLEDTLGLSTYSSDELSHLAHSEYEGKIYNLAGESDYYGISIGQYDHYWLFECDPAESRCTVIHTQPDQPEFWFGDGPTELVHDISNNSLVMMIQGEIVYTIHSEDK